MFSVYNGVFFFQVLHVADSFNKTYLPDVFYIDGKCNKTYIVNLRVEIRISTFTSIESKKNCTITLESSRDPLKTTLVATFIAYNLECAYTQRYGNCEDVSIQLYNSNAQALLPGDNGYCRYLRPLGHYELRERGSISLTTFKDGPLKSPIIKLLVVEMIMKIHSHSACPENYFDCSYKNFCVAEGLVCNDVDECGNGNDETKGCDFTMSGVVMLIGALVVIIILIIVGFQIMIKIQDWE